MTAYLNCIADKLGSPFPLIFRGVLFGHLREDIPEFVYGFLKPVLPERGNRCLSVWVARRRGGRRGGDGLGRGRRRRAPGL